MDAISSFRWQISTTAHFSDTVDWTSRNCSTVFCAFIISSCRSSRSSGSTTRTDASSQVEPQRCKITQENAIELLKSRCLPSLYCGLEACPLSSADFKSLEYVVVSAFMKMFNTRSKEVATSCIEMVNFTFIGRWQLFTLWTCRQLDVELSWVVSL